MGKIQCSINCKPQHKTQPQHTTTNMSRCRPTLQLLLPSLSMSMGTSTMDPNLGAADPYGPIQGARHRVCSCSCLFLRLGHQTCNTSKIRERDMTLALGGHLLVRQHNNQPKVGICGRRDIGEGARSGRNVWGRCHTIVWGGKLSNKK